MAKIYDQNQRTEPGKGYKPPTESVQTQKRAMAILVALVLGLIIVLLLYRMARSEGITGSETNSSVPVATATYVYDR